MNLRRSRGSMKSRLALSTKSFLGQPLIDDFEFMVDEKLARPFHVDRKIAGLGDAVSLEIQQSLLFEITPVDEGLVGIVRTISFGARHDDDDFPETKLSARAP